MPRALCLGNGNLQVNIDNNISIRDMFFPLGRIRKSCQWSFLQVWGLVDGGFSWIDSSWNRRLSYKEDSLATDFLLKNPDLQLGLYIIIRDMIPTGKGGKPLYFILGSLITIANI